MKRPAVMLFALALLLCSGCGLWGDPANEPLIVVHSGEKDVAPYQQFRWSQSWSNDGWLSADGVYLSRELTRKYQELPELTYDDSFDIRCRNAVSVISVSIYDSEFNSIYSNMPSSIISNLSTGTYYLIITVKEQHNYITAAKDYESTGYDCGYKLIVP